MAARRLTKYDRTKITDAVVAQVFDAKLEALTLRENALAIEVLNSQISPAQQKLMAQLPARFFGNPDHGHYVRAVQPETNNIILLHFKTGTPLPAFIKGSTVLVEDAALWSEIDSLNDDSGKVQADKNAFRQKTRGVVNSFTTFKMALDTWPTLRELMGEDFFSEEPPANVPAPLVNELDTALIAALAA